MLKTLFSNLFDNACKFSDHKECQVKISFTPTSIQVAVIDQGPGIPSEGVALIYTPFYRAENVRRHPGHGLGLSICRKIISLHQGRLQLHTQVGKGTTFSVERPHLELKNTAISETSAND